jgi:MoaA/NifB/PqqE/SkfB family radical SAM enzyme
MIKNNFPDYFIFELSSVCNFWCKMCYNSWKSWMKNPWKQLNFREQIKVLDIIWWLWKTVVFTWWEPTLNANIYELVEYAKKLWLKVILITNWSTIDFWKISLLKEKWVTTIQLSFHSWNEKAFNDITWTENFYNLIKTNIIDSLQIFWSDNVFINIVPNKFPFDWIMETCSNLFEIWIRNITVWIPVYSW